MLLDNFYRYQQSLYLDKAANRSTVRTVAMPPRKHAPARTQSKLPARAVRRSARLAAKEENVVTHNVSRSESEQNDLAIESIDELPREPPLSPQKTIGDLPPVLHLDTANHSILAKAAPGMRPEGSVPAGLQTEEDRMRAFDMDTHYGPALGITRMQRYTRAKALNLNPPADIEKLLIAHHGLDRHFPLQY